MLRHMSAAAFGLAAFLLCGPWAVAQTCLKPETLRENLTQNFADIELRTLEHKTATAFIVAFNAVPPVSHLHADAIVLARHRQSPQAVAVFFWRGCMVSRAVLPVGMLDALLASIEKEA